VRLKNEAHGAGTATAQKVFELKPDILITGNGPGETASNALKHLEIRIFINAHGMTIKQALQQYKKREASGNITLKSPYFIIY